jgi:hypothetical protein
MIDGRARSAGSLSGGDVKNDLTYVAILIAFFALAALFVIACDKIIGPDEIALRLGEHDTIEPEPVDEVAA